MTKEEIIDQLKKNGVTDLDKFADFVVKNTQVVQGANKPVANSVIIASHGFVTH
jgi:hypothetical protein